MMMHLKKFAQNKKRCYLTATSEKMAAMKILCDRFHFKNHVDRWCKNNCYPNEFDDLKVTSFVFSVLLSLHLCESLWPLFFKRVISTHFIRLLFVLATLVFGGFVMFVRAFF